MRTHTGKKPANLLVLSEFIYPKTQRFVMTNIVPLVLWWLPLSFCSAIRTHTGENPEQLQVLSECNYPTNMIACNEKRRCCLNVCLPCKNDCNEKLMPTILVVICAQIIHCHDSAYL